MVRPVRARLIFYVLRECVILSYRLRKLHFVMDIQSVKYSHPRFHARFNKKSRLLIIRADHHLSHVA